MPDSSLNAFSGPDAGKDMAVNQKRLIELKIRLDNLAISEPARHELRIERSAIMWEGGCSLLAAHIWMDTNPDLYGDIKTLEVLAHEQERHG